MHRTLTSLGTTAVSDFWFGVFTLRFLPAWAALYNHKSVNKYNKDELHSYYSIYNNYMQVMYFTGISLEINFYSVIVVQSFI